MAAKIETDDDGTLRIICGSGEYGFGTIGQARASHHDTRVGLEKEAWRMVQRAGLAKEAVREDVRFDADGPSLFVTYGVRPPTREETDAHNAAVVARGEPSITFTAAELRDMFGTDDDADAD